MLIEHRGEAPRFHSSAYVAPTAAVCGAVHVEADARILFGAVLTAEDGEVTAKWERRLAGMYVRCGQKQ